MRKLNKLVTIRIITVLMLISLPFLGSDCEDIINQISTPTGTLQGDWTLIYNAGTLLDICPGEEVNFPSNTDGSATLTCPNQSPISRNYTVTGTTLTYTASGIEYNIDFTQNNELVLTGINNNRILYYSTSISSKPQNTTNSSNTASYNSSEIKK